MSSEETSVRKPIFGDIDFWQDMSHADKIDKILNNEVLDDLVDCQFLVGPEEVTAKTIKGHKLMFTLQSPALEKMLIGTFIESEKNHKIRVDDVLPQDFENFRYMIYHNNYSKLSRFSFEEIFGIYHVANKYLASSICEDCLKFLMASIQRTLSFDRLLVVYEFAASELEDKRLQETVEKEISQRSAEIMLNGCINEFSAKTFYTYLHFVSKFQLRAISIFKAIQSYLDYNHLLEKPYKPMDKLLAKNDVEESNQICLPTKETKGKKKDVQSLSDVDICREDLKIYNFKQNLLKLVKFDQMTTREFTDGPGKSNLFGIQEKYDMLAQLCMKTTTKGLYQ